jgi:signal transduction histidine kinase
VGQVLRNLLNNAIIHTPPTGSIALRASSEFRVLSSESPGNQAPTQNSKLKTQNFVVIHVSDSGPGIAPEHLPHIFERFYRADRARARATGGAGLGLTIVKQLVEAHGGQVWAASRPGQGATFTFTLPVAQTTDE